MPQITFTIDNAKVQLVIDTLKWLFPIPDINNDGLPDFTDQQWIKESIRRWIIHQVKQYQDSMDRDAVNNLRDENLVS